MIALLDVNLLVALFDGAHIHHESAHEWFGRQRDQGWGTCPLTENGLVRVVSNAAYPGRRTTVADALDRLRTFALSGGHVFWDDSLSLRDAALIDPDHIGGAGRVTDVDLLALAVRHGGRLATFDRRISRSAVIGAKTCHLAVIESSAGSAEAAQLQPNRRFSPVQQSRQIDEHGGAVMRNLIIAIAIGMILGIGLAASSQVFPIRWDSEPEAPLVASPGVIVADAIILRPVTQAPFACDATTKGAVIYNGESGTTTDQRVCFCTDDGTWKNINLSDCGFTP